MGFTPEERARCRIVGTPIGNLGDMTARAAEALREADIIFAEDTRNTKALLHHLNISKHLKAYHKDNEQEAAEAALAALQAGSRIALVSDAGMPGISDPGYLLVKALLDQGIPFEIVPGVSAATHAAVASGLCASGQYLFYGFLPHKGAERALQSVLTSRHPVIFYESPHRIKDTISLLLRSFPPPVAVCRELTKLHEEVLLINDEAELAKLTVKGEFCLVVQPNTAPEATEGKAELAFEEIAKLLAAEKLPTKTISNVLKGMGMKRNEAYELAQRAR
ncbi:MAG: 16S rRNA (cytidine(1402)-2'-O)-methyltransferase [Deferribacteraceae bacterium]|jgi:16S rRNA (cytidine1402-2'-O)-methyltransferase|nr:16S rRNA (cytidine(1402)-2'-O)-methyltransferase [Deferribacteraceae bacterium]